MGEREDHIEVLAEIAEGREAAADAEQFVIDGLQPFVDRFLNQDDRSPEVMRRLRVYNDAKANQRWARKESAAAKFALEALQYVA